MILSEVPLLVFEKKLDSGRTYSKECCFQMIKDIIHKNIQGGIHFVDDDVDDVDDIKYCLTISNPNVKVIETDDDSELTLFCTIEIDEDIVDKSMFELLQTNPFRAYPMGYGDMDDDIIVNYEIVSVNIEIIKN